MPQAFDAASRPAVRFHHITTFADTDIGTHPLASRLPRATADGRSSVQACGDDFRHLGVPDWPSFPKRIDDYCYGADNDEPLLALLVMSFADATLVSLNVPHLVTDAMGLSAIVTNWCRMLAGREDEVVPLAPTATIDEVGAGKLYRSKEGDEEGLKVLVGWSFFLFALRFFLDIVLGPAMHTRTLFLSARTIEVLRRRTAADLVSRTEGGQPPFVSDGDIITAWGTRMVARGLGAGSQRRLTAMNVFELRSRLKTIFRPAAAYVQNTVFVSATDFSGPEARGLGDSRGEAATTLGDMALRVRHDLARQTAEPHVHTLVAAYRTSLAEQGRPAVVARSDGMPVIITNWCKARFYEVTDFGPAVVSGLEGQKGGNARLPHLVQQRTQSDDAQHFCHPRKGPALQLLGGGLALVGRLGRRRSGPWGDVRWTYGVHWQ